MVLSLSCSKKSTNGDTDGIANSEFVIKVPSEIPTIKMAIEVANPGDTILIADGIYSGLNNRDIVISSKSIVIKSENGAGKTIIDCGGDSLDYHFGFEIRNRGSNGTIIDGITIKNGYNIQAGAIFFSSSSPVIKNCVFVNNRATISGGAVKCKGSSPSFINCTFANNRALSGAAIFLIATSQPTFENCIIAFSKDSEAIRCNESSSVPTLSCCNIFSNEGGDWIDCLLVQFNSQSNLNGNMSQNPLFCDTMNGNFALMPSSSCNAGNNSCNQLIGALESGCN